MNQPLEMGSGTSPGGAVLLVDEDLEQLEWVGRVIQGIGYVVTSCGSYAEGLRALAIGTFDIVVMGQGSRNFEGRCVLEGASAVNRRLPVVGMARHLEMGCYLEAMQLGAVDYIAGPFGSTEIVRVMRNWMPRRKAAVEVEQLTANQASGRPVA